jgi:hypothetical protein
MRSDVFNDLVKGIKPNRPQRYPQKLFNTLIKLKDDLPENTDYEHFLEDNGLSMGAEWVANLNSVIQDPSIYQEPRKEREEHDIEPKIPLLPGMAAVPKPRLPY